MQEAEEQDTCRICSAPAEPDQPLFHPCKCSGTIRYIHQDCLTTWLAHSKKKTCDTCRHQFLFKKVYAPDMPSTLPPLLMMRRLIQQGFYALLMVVRAIVVSLVWLSLVPLLTVWSWRAYFRMGESIAWWISNRQPLPGQEDLRPTNKFLVREIIELTHSFLDDPTPPPSDISTLINRIVSHPRWLSISADIFTGQIIAALIVITFVAIFLLREWIAQNARPGQFDDEDGQDILQVPPAPEAKPSPPRRRGSSFHAVLRIQGLALPNAETSSERTTTTTTAPPSSFFPTVALERPNGSIPFSFVYPPKSDPDSTSGESSSFPSHGSNFDIPNFASTAYVGPPPLIPTVIPSSNTSISSPGTPIRRPPLPTTLPSSPGSGTSSPSVKTPLASPNLATYRAPEELVNSDNEDYFAGPSTSALAPVSEQAVEADDEDDDTETLDGHEVDEGEDSTSPLIPDHGEMDEEIRTYFREEATDGSDEGESDTEPELVIDLPEPEARNAEQHEEPHVVDLQDGNEVAGADEDEEDDEEEDEEEDEEGEDEIAEEFQVRPQLREGAAVAFNAGVRRVIQLDANAPPPLALAPIPGFPARPQPQQGPLVLNADDALLDELEAGVDDDMDGAMEAIGLRGPIYGLAQNAALMIFIMDSVIGLAMWIPYTLGKSTAFLMLEPQRMLFILHLPIRAIRLVTDPAVDLVAYIIIDVLLPPHIQLLQTSGAWVVQLFFWVISEYLGEVKTKKMRESFMVIYSFLESCFESVIHALNLAEDSTEEIVHSTPKIGVIPSFLARTFPDFMDYIEPYFATLGREIRQGHEQFRGVWTQLAIGNGPAERIFSVVFGYCIIASALAVYMNILTIGNVKTAGRAVRTAVKQQLLVLKVASFIFIELVTFPLGCGVVLDICTLWFFPGASYVSRMEFSYQAPLTAIFYHWVAGTMFMYSFAVLLSGCRSIMRPGFVDVDHQRDPTGIRTAALTRVRDICRERAALFQLRYIN
ncbi:ERAD-associated E3 ubiquitin-protein ligase doa10 [Lentinula edodes]|uniref:RING-type E3 ubiquitin transferase n=1 Tax=Lentinula edodes TaxID=5353 RepID=A0A1Q3E848_LENED|nr:ERAD-associated E3 ubiquitin-protein ligase doa10 [Lentinula edodes]